MGVSAPTEKPFQVTTGELFEHHNDHILVKIGDTVARVDDRDVEGVTALRDDHVLLLGLEYRNELGVISSLHLSWAGTRSSFDRYCRRVAENAAINVMNEFGEYGAVERSGFRFDDHQIDFFPADDSEIVRWEQITGFEDVDGSIVIWTGESEHPELTFANSAPNALVLQKLVPPMVAAHGQETQTRQLVGELSGTRYRHYHPLMVFALLSGFCSAALMRHGEFGLHAVLASLCCLLCVPLLFWVARKLSKRKASLKLYRDCIELSIGLSRVRIPWDELSQLIVHNTYRKDETEGPFRRRLIHLNAPHCRIMSDDMHLVVDASGDKLRLVEWIRERAKRERTEQMLDDRELRSNNSRA